MGFAAVAGFGLGVVTAESEAGAAAAAAEVGGLDGGAGEGAGAEADVEEGGAAAASGCGGGGASMVFDELPGRSVRGTVVPLGCHWECDAVAVVSSGRWWRGVLTVSHPGAPAAGWELEGGGAVDT